MKIQLEKTFMLGKQIPEIPPGWEWIVGGAVRSWFCGDNLEDIDLLFKSEENLNSYGDLLITQKYKKTHSHKNADTYKKEDIIIQLIKKYWVDIDGVFNSFDYDLCCFAIDASGLIFSTDKAIISALRKRLSVNNIQAGYELDSLRRAFKYFEKGYKPCLGCLADIAHSLGMSGERISQQISFYQDGKPRIARFD